MSKPASIDTTTAVAGSVLALVLVAGYVVIAALHLDTIGYALFVTGPVVSTIVGAVLARKVAVVKAVAEDVKVATDGILSGRLDSLDDQLASASDERVSIAAGGSVPRPAAGAGQDGAGPQPLGRHTSPPADPPARGGVAGA